MICGKVCEEGLPKVKFEQEGEESWEGSAKKVAEGRETSELEAARAFLKMRQTRYVDGQNSQ